MISSQVLCSKCTERSQSYSSHIIDESDIFVDFIKPTSHCMIAVEVLDFLVDTSVDLKEPRRSPYAASLK